MTQYETDIRALAPLEAFDASAFVGNTEWPQELCDFVLALALAHNDLRDVIFAERLLVAVAPSDLAKITPELGMFGGLHLHLTRLLAASLHELTSLIHKAGAILNHPRFLGVVKLLHASARKAWEAAVAASFAKPSVDPLAMLLVRIRNKVSFHYDPEEIGKAYRAAFVQVRPPSPHSKNLPRPTKEPLLSRGSSMAVTRFYFADAATAVYIAEIVDQGTAEQLFPLAMPLVHELNHGIRELVTRFVTARGYAWRTPAT